MCAKVKFILPYELLSSRDVRKARWALHNAESADARTESFYVEGVSVIDLEASRLWGYAMYRHKQITSPRPILAFALLVAVCTLSLVITLTVSAFRLYNDYRDARALVSKQVENASKIVGATVAEGLWRVDPGLLQLELQSVLAFPDISFAEVRESSNDPKPLTISVGERTAGPSVDKTYPVIYKVGGKESSVGTLQIQASLSALSDKTIGVVIDVLVNQAVNTFCVAFSTFFVLYRLVTRHLADIALRLANYDFRESPEPLSLRRRSSRVDELQQVVNALNEMSNRLYAAYVTERKAEIERDDERTLAEAQLHASEQRLRTILEASPVPMCITSKVSGLFLYTNAPFRTLFEIKESDALYLNAEGLFQSRADQDRLIGELNEKNSFASVELQLRKRNGSKFWAVVTATLAYYESDLAVFTGVNDITDRKALEIELIESREHLRRLSAHMESVREEERQHIALEIHDELGQLLTALKMDVALLKLNLADNSNVIEKLSGMQALLDDTMLIVRNVASHLRPASLNLGIVPALDWLSRDFSKRHRISCRFQAVGIEPSLANAVATALFRIAQESLTNVARHAKASFIEIHLVSTTTSVEMKIFDDGSGFNVQATLASHPFGLFGMAERARLINGIFTIVSGPDLGTTVSVLLPKLG